MTSKKEFEELNGEAIGNSEVPNSSSKMNEDIDSKDKTRESTELTESKSANKTGNESDKEVNIEIRDESITEKTVNNDSSKGVISSENNEDIEVKGNWTSDNVKDSNSSETKKTSQMDLKQKKPSENEDEIAEEEKIEKDSRDEDSSGDKDAEGDYEEEDSIEDNDEHEVDFSRLDDLSDDEAIVELDKIVEQNDELIEKDYLSALLKQNDNLVFYHIENIYHNERKRAYKNRLKLRRDPPVLVVRDEEGNEASFKLTENLTDELAETLKEVKRAYYGFSGPRDINKPDKFIAKVKYYAKRNAFKILATIFIVLFIVSLNL